jgi:hypothetical protein
VVPVLIPVTSPDPDPTVATPAVPEVHVPPDGDELIVVIDPIQTPNVPDSAVGAILTVTGAVTIQPPVTV